MLIAYALVFLPASRTERVHVHRELEFFQLRFQHRSAGPDAGVVHQAVQVATGFRDDFDSRCDVLRTGHIQPHSLTYAGACAGDEHCLLRRVGCGESGK
ncbi:MAG TPA: hypothetical protein VJT80_01980 [Steroidobacteraceae bacterium]|nr:hypothetical protein [Steroidobacteraceae bacterium]